MSSDGKQKRVLVVEDDPDFKTMLQNCISLLAPDIDLVECADDAIAALKKMRYDLVIVDIWLPTTRKALDKKRELESKYDELTEELMRLDKDDHGDKRRDALRDQMEEIIQKSRATQERRGGLTIFEKISGSENNVRAILFLTAIGNRDMLDDAKTVVSPNHYKFSYLVKPQSPEAIAAHARQLLELD